MPIEQCNNPSNVIWWSIQVMQSGGQLWKQYKWRHLVEKFAGTELDMLMYASFRTCPLSIRQFQQAGIPCIICFLTVNHCWNLPTLMNKNLAYYIITSASLLCLSTISISSFQTSLLWFSSTREAYFLPCLKKTQIYWSSSFQLWMKGKVGIWAFGNLIFCFSSPSTPF